jgi:hypothetical protein
MKDQRPAKLTSQIDSPATTCLTMENSLEDGYSLPFSLPPRN